MEIARGWPRSCAVTDYAALLAELAVPRLVGTPNHAQVREVLKRELAARGFTVEELAFTARPPRVLFGAPPRVHGVNLLASPVPAPGRPAVWLMAHYDAKGQPVSMALRLAGAAALVGGVLLLPVAFVPGLAVAAAGGLVLAGNRVTNRTPGAVDNASGVVAVLMLVDLLSPSRRRDVGVVFSDAEEMGLLGARALVADAAARFQGTAVVNFDGLDDSGRPIAVLHRPGPVGRAVAAALGARRARWLPVIVDGLALAGAARECVTIIKGTWRTMRVVHTSRDDAARLTLAGAREVARGVARALATP